MGQKWCPLKLGGHQALRRLRQEDVLAGRIPSSGFSLSCIVSSTSLLEA